MAANREHVRAIVAEAQRPAPGLLAYAGESLFIYELAFPLHSPPCVGLGVASAWAGGVAPGLLLARVYEGFPRRLIQPKECAGVCFGELPA